MDNVISIPKNLKKSIVTEKDADILPFPKKEKGIMIDTSSKKEVFNIEDFLQNDDDVLFIG